MAKKDKILIIGGYGKVGSVVSERLAREYPSKVIIGGRNLHIAKDLINQKKLDATCAYIDIENQKFEEIDFKCVHTAISCIETMNTSFIIDCIMNKVNYSEVGTSFKVHQRFFKLLDYIENSEALIVPSVGLVPGLSNIIAFNEAKKFIQINGIHTFVMLGTGESHGLGAVRWMMENTLHPFKIKSEGSLVSVKGFTRPKSTRLLNEKRKRVFYLFDFSDHHVIRIFTKTNSSDTRLSFDSRVVTYLFYLFQKWGLLKWLKYLKPSRLKKILTFMPIGKERFALQVEISGKYFNDKKLVHKCLVTGQGEAFITGLVTSYAAKLLYENTNQKGLKHIEEICDFAELKTILEQHNIQFLNQYKS